MRCGRGWFSAHRLHRTVPKQTKRLANKYPEASAVPSSHLFVGRRIRQARVMLCAACMIRRSGLQYDPIMQIPISLPQPGKLEATRMLQIHPPTNAAYAARANPKTRPLVGSPLTTFIDLFCGIGGFHYAAAELGLNCVFASENDEQAARQYEQNFGIRPAGDITTIRCEEIPPHDMLFGGFPCQPFSIIGNRRSLADRRGTLILEIIRVLRHRQPTAFVLENVRQLATIDGGRTLQSILSALGDSGYWCDWKVLNALDFGLPQKRERIIIVGIRTDVVHDFEWPKPQDQFTPLHQILEHSPAKHHYVSDPIRRRRHAMHRSEHRPGIWHENKAGNVNSHPFSCALRAGASHNYLLVDGERRLTPREMLRLQGFPESFVVMGNDSQIRKQAGNAVPVPLVQAVIEQVILAVDRG